MEYQPYIAGALSLIISTIVRAMIQRQTADPKGKRSNLFGIPKRDDPNDYFAALWQLMGITWILIGVLFAFAADWFSKSMLRSFLQLLLLLIPGIVPSMLLRMRLRAISKGEKRRINP